MKTFKITNISNLAGKRDAKFNMVIDIEYIDNRTKKVIKLKAGDSVFLTIDSLPLSVHRLRIKNLITIEEVRLAEQIKSTEKPIPPPIKKPTKKVIIENNDELEVESEKKPTSRKKTVTH